MLKAQMSMFLWEQESGLWKASHLKLRSPLRESFWRFQRLSTPNTMLSLFSKLLVHLNRNFEEYAFMLQNSLGTWEIRWKIYSTCIMSKMCWAINFKGYFRLHQCKIYWVFSTCVLTYPFPSSSDKQSVNFFMMNHTWSSLSLSPMRQAELVPALSQWTSLDLDTLTANSNLFDTIVTNVEHPSLANSPHPSPISVVG